jgi:hypothetical protein
VSRSTQEIVQSAQHRAGWQIQPDLLVDLAADRVDGRLARLEPTAR